MKDKLKIIEKLAEKDSVYQHMLEENKILEERFDLFCKRPAGGGEGYPLGFCDAL